MNSRIDKSFGVYLSGSIVFLSKGIGSPLFTFLFQNVVLLKHFSDIVVPCSTVLSFTTKPVLKTWVGEMKQRGRTILANKLILGKFVNKIIERKEYVQVQYPQNILNKYSLLEKKNYDFGGILYVIDVKYKVSKKKCQFISR